MAEQSFHDVVIQAQSVDEPSSTDVSATPSTDPTARAASDKSSNPSNNTAKTTSNSTTPDKPAETDQVRALSSENQDLKRKAGSKCTLGFLATIC